MDGLVGSLREQGLISEAHARQILELESRAHVPLTREVHALLYLGAALILAGVAAAVKDRLDQIGPATILMVLATAIGACFFYCARRTPPFALGKVDSPTVAFDYVLYLACGLVGIFFSYLEWKWKILGSWWDLYLFLSGLLFSALAYRFDNRLVLTTGLLNLAAWLGFRMSLWHAPTSGMRTLLAVYGASLMAAAVGSRRSGVKPHFEDTYMRLGTHLALCSLLFDADRFYRPQLWILLAACGALGTWSLGKRRFETFATALVYAYAACLSAFFHSIRPSSDFTLWTLVLSAGSLIAVLLWARARFREAT